METPAFSSMIFPAIHLRLVEDLPAVFDDTKGYCRAFKQPQIDIHQR